MPGEQRAGAARLALRERRGGLLGDAHRHHLDLLPLHPRLQHDEQRDVDVHLPRQCHLCDGSRLRARHDGQAGRDDGAGADEPALRDAGHGAPDGRPLVRRPRARLVGAAHLRRRRPAPPRLCLAALCEALHLGICLGHPPAARRRDRGAHSLLLRQGRPHQLHAAAEHPGRSQRLPNHRLRCHQHHHLLCAADFRRASDRGRGCPERSRFRYPATHPPTRPSHAPPALYHSHAHSR